MRSSLRGPLLAWSILAGVTTVAPSAHADLSVLPSAHADLSVPPYAHADLSVPPATTVVPVVLWGVTGAVIGTMALPVVFPSLAGAAAGASPAMGWTWQSFLTARSLAGAVMGGAVGYAISPP